MSGWDNTSSGNGYIYEGDFEDKHDRGKNPIYAYTFYPGSNWLSFDTPIEYLPFDTETNSKKKLDLYISIPPQGGLERWFETYRHSGPPPDLKLRIHIFTKETQQLAYKTVVIYHVKVKDRKPGEFLIKLPKMKSSSKMKSFSLPLPNLIYILEYDSIRVV